MVWVLGQTLGGSRAEGPCMGFGAKFQKSLGKCPGWLDFAGGPHRDTGTPPKGGEVRWAGWPLPGVLTEACTEPWVTSQGGGVQEWVGGLGPLSKVRRRSICGASVNIFSEVSEVGGVGGCFLKEGWWVGLRGRSAPSPRSAILRSCGPNSGAGRWHDAWAVRCATESAAGPRLMCDRHSLPSVPQCFPALRVPLFVIPMAGSPPGPRWASRPQVAENVCVLSL